MPHATPSPPLAYDPASVQATRTLLAEIGAVPNRTYGQNFLVNADILDRIAEAASLEPADQVLEIGPGLGALTCRLCSRAGAVTAVEKDPQFLHLLRRYLPSPNLRLVKADALEVTWGQLALPPQNCKVVANLPYFISKPMLRRLLEEWRDHFQSITVLVQREVAERIVAAPGAAAYGPIAIMTRLHGDARRVFDVRPGSFLPAPNVLSSVVHVRVLQTPRLAVDEAHFWLVVRAAFGQRRKQLANTLKPLVGSNDALNAALRAAGIDSRRRGETLALEEFAELSFCLRNV